MADLKSYWEQIQKSESFQDLDGDQREKVRGKLFDSYIQTSNSYLDLPQSQRIKVKQHFDEMTIVKPESMVESITRKGKGIVKEGKEIIQKGKDIVGSPQVQKAKALAPFVPEVLGAVEKAIEPPPVQKTFETAEKVAGGISKGAAALGEKIEPTEEEMAQHVQKTSDISDFDKARLFSSGVVRTAGEFLAGAIPTGPVQLASYPALDAVFKYAGTTFLGKELHLPGWKPKGTGLSKEAVSIGDDFEKIVTKRRIENNSRQMRDGPPKPLEILSHKEETLKTQDELQQYEEWLKQADQTSERGGEPQGDLHPEAKVNVSQLRDMAKDRLQKLQGEPVRVESLSHAEDELQGYFRRKIDQERVYFMPEASVPRETIPQLEAPPGPAGLLKAGPKPKKAPLEGPAPKAPPITTGPATPPTDSFGEGIKAYKDYLTAAFKSRLPGSTKQAIDNLSGSMLSVLKDQQFIHPTKPKPITREMMTFLDRVVDGATEQQGLEKPKLSPGISKVAEDTRLREKGLDPTEVRTEAARLHNDHQAIQGISSYEDFIQENGGISMNPEDAQGRVPEKEEYIRNVPIHLRGQTTPDQMAQALFEAGLQEDASTSTMYSKLSERKAAGEKRSVKSFLDEAEYRLENQKMADSGFKKGPEQEGLPGMPARQMPGTGLGKTEGQVPGDQLMEGFRNQDENQRSIFDIASDINRHLGEKGQIGGEVDPVRQAALESAVKELVDRAMSLGYQTSQDIMLYAAKNAPAELRDALRKNLHPTLSPFDTHAYKEMEEAKKGNPIAKKSLMDSAMRDYLKEKYEWTKGIRKRRKVSQIIGQFHDGDEAKMRLVNDLFMHDHMRNIDANEAAALRWHIEGKAPSLDALKKFKPEEEAKAMLEKYEHPTDLMKKAAEAIRPRENEWHELMSEFYDSLGYAENYVTRRWKQPREFLNWEGRILGDRVPFVKGRKLLTHADGIEAGYEPKSFDIRDDLRASNDVRVRLLTRLHDLRKIGATFDEKGIPSIIQEDAGGMSSKAKITAKFGKAPDHWLRYQGVPLLRGLAINPDYKPAIDYIFGARYKGLPIEIYEHLGALSKSAILGYSLFHPMSLTEMLLGGVSYRDVFTFNANKNVMAKFVRNFGKAATADLEGSANIQSLYKSFMSGHGALANRPLALEMAEHGFKLGAVDEHNYNILSTTLSKYEGWLKARAETMPKGKGSFKEAAETVKGIREAGDLMQKFIFDYMRPLTGMTLYESHLADNIKTFNLAAEEGKKIPIEQLKFSTANMVSKMVGGISMGTLLVTPRAQQFLQWAMMAPDWTIGRALIPGTAAFGKGPGRPSGQETHATLGCFLLRFREHA
jgi:hypothetical protein